MLRPPRVRRARDERFASKFLGIGVGYREPRSTMRAPGAVVLPGATALVGCRTRAYRNPRPTSSQSNADDDEAYPGSSLVCGIGGARHPRAGRTPGPACTG